MDTVVQMVQLLVGLGSCAIALVKFNLLCRIAERVQAREPMIIKPCPRCRGTVLLPRWGGPILGLKVQCPHCKANLVCNRKTKR